MSLTCCTLYCLRYCKATDNFFKLSSEVALSARGGGGGGPMVTPSRSPGGGTSASVGPASAATVEVKKREAVVIQRAIRHPHFQNISLMVGGGGG